MSEPEFVPGRADADGIITTAAEIVVKFTAEGFHHWPDAPDHRSYLRWKHRHLFHVVVRTRVGHDNREVEFHDLLDFCKSNFIEPTGGPESCETMARSLAVKVTKRFKRACFVAVLEDNECGAEVGAIL